MKKILTFTIIALGLAVYAQTTKTYTVKLTQQEAEALLFIMDKSVAPHNAVQEMKLLIINQIQEQMQDSTKIK